MAVSTLTFVLFTCYLVLLTTCWFVACILNHTHSCPVPIIYSMYLSCTISAYTNLFTIGTYYIGIAMTCVSYHTHTLVTTTMYTTWSHGYDDRTERMVPGHAGKYTLTTITLTTSAPQVHSHVNTITMLRPHPCPHHQQ